jgi:hypothetical protein
MIQFEYDEKFTPDSSFIEEIYYDSENWRLFVKVGDKVYGYWDVPLSTYDMLKDSLSVGHFYNTKVKSYHTSISGPFAIMEREASGYDWEVTVQVISTIKVKADNVEDAKRLALEGMPDSVVVKEVKISFE